MALVSWNAHVRWQKQWLWYSPILRKQSFDYPKHVWFDIAHMIKTPKTNHAFHVCDPATWRGGFRDPPKTIHTNGKESWVPKGTNNKKVMLLNASSCYTAGLEIGYCSREINDQLSNLKYPNLKHIYIWYIYRYSTSTCISLSLFCFSCYRSFSHVSKQQQIWTGFLSPNQIVKTYPRMAKTWSWWHHHVLFILFIKIWMILN